MGVNNNMGLCNNCRHGILRNSFVSCRKKDAIISERTECSYYLTKDEKLKIFIGSSGSPRALKIADCVHIALEDMGINPSVWKDGLFEPSKTNIENLVKALDTFNAGVFVFHPEDILTIDEYSKLSVRDNVLFELGLFIGRFGRDRVFIYHPNGDFSKIRIPSDLLGVAMVLYEARRLEEQENNWSQALGPKIREHIGLKLVNL